MIENENKKITHLFIEWCDNWIIIHNKNNDIEIKKHLSEDFIQLVNNTLNEEFWDYPINILFYWKWFICEKDNSILIFNYE